MEYMEPALSRSYSYRRRVRRPVSYNYHGVMSSGGHVPVYVEPGTDPAMVRESISSLKRFPDESKLLASGMVMGREVALRPESYGNAGYYNPDESDRGVYLPDRDFGFQIDGQPMKIKDQDTTVTHEFVHNRQFNPVDVKDAIASKIMRIDSVARQMVDELMKGKTEFYDYQNDPIEIQARYVAGAKPTTKEEFDRLYYSIRNDLMRRYLPEFVSKRMYPALMYRGKVPMESVEQKIEPIRKEY